MLPGLQEEIIATGFTNVAPSVFLKMFNAPGSYKGIYINNEERRINPDPVYISRNHLMMECLSFTSGISFSNFLDGDGSFNRYVNRVFSSIEGAGINMSSATVRTLFTTLHTDYSIGTEAEYKALMRVGEIKISRGEELTLAAEGTARYLTLEDFE